MADGKRLVLQALAGQATSRIPVALLTWGYDYLWRVAGLEPWQLACGGRETWHRAHLALLERHDVDAIMYSGAGTGPEEPTLLAEDGHKWVVRDNNTGRVWALGKQGLALYNPEDEGRSADPGHEIHTRADADRLVAVNHRPSGVYLQGLRRLVDAVGDRALVIPSSEPSYIRGCFAFGFERAMTAMIEDPGLFTYVCDRYAAAEPRNMQDLAAAGAQAVLFADSWASCDIISPQQFERFAWPYQVASTRATHAAGMAMILWNLGDIVPVLHLEAAIPVEGFAFEQPRKTFAVSVAQVRRAFGPRRCLFGNIDPEDLFLRNDPAEIAREVAEQIRQSGPGAPFVVCTGSPIPSNVEPSAVDAMVEATRSCRPG